MEVVMTVNSFMHLFFAAMFVFWAFSVSATPPGTQVANQYVAQNDTIEYELLIIDPAFERWYLLNHRPEGFYSLEYLENWNRLLSNQWNSMFSRRIRPECMPGNYLQYNSGISYGITLNHKLFHYFMYMQERCRIFDQFPVSWRK